MFKGEDSGDERGVINHHLWYWKIIDNEKFNFKQELTKSNLIKNYLAIKGNKRNL